MALTDLSNLFSSAPAEPTSIDELFTDAPQKMQPRDPGYSAPDKIRLDELSQFFVDTGKYVTELAKSASDPAVIYHTYRRAGGRLDQALLSNIEAAARLPEDLAVEFAKLMSPDLSRQIKENPTLEQAFREGFSGPERLIPERETIQYMQETLRDYTQKVAPYSKQAQQAAVEGRFWDPSYVVEHGADVGADLAIAVGASALHPGAGLAILAGEAGGLTREEALQRLRARGEDEGLANIKATGEGLLAAGAVAATERFTLGQFKPSKAIDNLIKNKFARNAAQTALAGGAEALSEAIETTVNDVSQALVEQDPDAFKGYYRRVLESAMFGGLGGAGARGAFGIADISNTRIRQISTQVADRVARRAKKDPQVFSKLQALADKAGEVSRRDLHKTGLSLDDLKLNAQERQLLVNGFSTRAVENAQQTQSTPIAQRLVPSPTKVQSLLDLAISKTTGEEQAEPIIGDLTAKLRTVYTEEQESRLDPRQKLRYIRTLAEQARRGEKPEITSEMAEYFSTDELAAFEEYGDNLLSAILDVAELDRATPKDLFETIIQKTQETFDPEIYDFGAMRIDDFSRYELYQLARTVENMVQGTDSPDISQLMSEIFAKTADQMQSATGRRDQNPLLQAPLSQLKEIIAAAEQNPYYLAGVPPKGIQYYIDNEVYDLDEIRTELERRQKLDEAQPPIEPTELKSLRDISNEDLSNLLDTAIENTIEKKRVEQIPPELSDFLAGHLTQTGEAEVAGQLRKDIQNIVTRIENPNIHSIYNELIQNPDYTGISEKDFTNLLQRAGISNPETYGDEADNISAITNMLERAAAHGTPASISEPDISTEQLRKDVDEAFTHAQQLEAQGAPQEEIDFAYENARILGLELVMRPDGSPDPELDADIEGESLPPTRQKKRVRKKQPKSTLKIRHSPTGTEAIAELMSAEDAALYVGEPRQMYWINRLTSKQKGQGGGSKVLNRLQQHSKRSGIPLLLEASAYEHTTDAQQKLIDFYKRRGFVPADPETYGDDLLIYDPTRPQTPVPPVPPVETAADVTAELENIREESKLKPPVQLTAEVLQTAKVVAKEIEDFSTQTRKRKKPALPPIIKGQEGWLDVSQIARVVQGMSTGTVAILGERPTKALKRVGKKIAAGLRSRGKLKPGTKKAWEQREFTRKAAAIETKFAVNELRTALEKSYRISSFTEIPENVAKHLNAVLRGDKPYSSVPNEIQAPLRKMRKHVDRLSRELLESNVIAGEIVGAFPQIPTGRQELFDMIRSSIESNDPTVRDALLTDLQEGGVSQKDAELIYTILSNEGIYLNRSYEAFSDPNWADKVPEEDRNLAKKWLRGLYPELSETEINRKIGEILYEAKEAGSPIKLIASGKLSTKDLSVLKHRKNLPEALRRLLGERTNPIDNYVITVNKVSTLIATQKMLEDIKADGLEKGYLFDPSDTTIPIPEDAVATFKPEESPRLTPLAGMKTFPEVKEALNELDAAKVSHPIMKAIMMAENASQIAKTAYSPMAAIRQIPSNAMIELANGHDPVRFRKHMKEILSNIRGRADAATQEKILDAFRYGVADENIDIQAIADRRNVDTIEEAFEELFEARRVGGANVKRVTDKLVDLPSQVYQSLDTIFKIASWNAEIEDYQKAFPDRDIEEIKALTAEIVRNINPTYSKIPPFFRALKRLPLGNFISFKTEVYRNDINRVFSIIPRELADPATRRIAAKRIAGMAAAKSIPTALKFMSMYFAGVTLSDDENMRRLVAPWSKWSNFFFRGRDEEGNIQYVDLAYSDPFSHETQISNILNNDDLSHNEKIVKAAMVVGEQYVEPKLLTRASIEFFAKTKESGAPIYNPEADLGSQVLDTLAHLWKAVEPGAFSSMTRVYRGLKGEVRGSKRYEFGPEIIAVTTGVRFETLDPRSALYYKAADWERSQPDISKIMRDEVKAAMGTGTNVVDNPQERLQKLAQSRPQLQRAYTEMMLADQASFDRIQKDTAAAVSLLKGYDFDTEDAAKVLRTGGIGKAAAQRIIENKYEPYIPSDIDQIDAMLLVATPEHKVALAAAKQNLLQSRAYAAGGDGESAEKARQFFKRIGMTVGQQRSVLLDRFKDDIAQSRARSLMRKLPAAAQDNDKLRHQLTAVYRKRLEPVQLDMNDLTDSQKKRFIRVGVKIGDE